MKSAKARISGEQKKFLNEIRTLRKLPKSAENRSSIISMRGQLSTRGTGSIDDEGTTVYFQSFSGKFLDGKKGVVVYSKRADQTWWDPVALFTWLTTENASAYFGYDTDNLYADHCEFYDADWEGNDNADSWPDLLDDDALRTALGIYDAKGWFDGGDEVYVTPAEILHGQKIVIYHELIIPGPNIYTVVNSFSTETKGTSTLWAVWVILVILILIVFYNTYQTYSKTSVSAPSLSINT